MNRLNHVAIIMDGNGRWGLKMKRSRNYGHLKGLESVELVIKESIKKKLPIYERADMLANIVSLKKNIIITGSHGRRTTTSLVAKILSEAKLDPTIINGGVINSIKNNA